MERFKISSVLFPCVSVDTYETLLSPYQLESDAMEREYPARPFSYAYVDFRDLSAEILRQGNAWIQAEVVPKMRKYGLEQIEVDSLHTPEEYNFSTDCLYLTAVMQDGWREKMHQWLKEFTGAKFQEYIKEHWMSRDGFFSFMPTTFAEIERMADKERCLSAYLTLCLLNEHTTTIDFNDFLIRSQEEIETEVYNEFGCCIYNALEEHFSNVDVESLLGLYESYEIDIIYWQIVEKSGFPWLHDNDTRSVEGEHEIVDATNDAQRFIVWAAKNGYDATELRRMAA